MIADRIIMLLLWAVILESIIIISLSIGGFFYSAISTWI
jgi:hypothetical protein